METVIGYAFARLLGGHARDGRACRRRSTTAREIWESCPEPNAAGGTRATPALLERWPAMKRWGEGAGSRRSASIAAVVDELIERRNDDDSASIHHRTSLGGWGYRPRAPLVEGDAGHRDLAVAEVGGVARVINLGLDQPTRPGDWCTWASRCRS